MNVWDFHENLDVEKLEKIIRALKDGKAACPAFTERMAQGGIA